MLKLSGTFVQPLCGGDTPVMSWRYEEWDKEFKLMKYIGIDTIILLRQALGKFLAYDSFYLKKLENAWTPTFDYMEMFLRLSEKHQMQFFVPTYNPNHDWLLDDYDPVREFEFLKPLIDEIWERYGNYPAFSGWYFAHEISRKVAWRVAELFALLGPYCKSISGNLPVMISPGVQGPKGLIADLYPPHERKKRSVTFDEHRSEWDDLFGIMHGGVDIVAFQDGHPDYEDLETFQKINVDLCRKHRLQSWSNLESFDRDIRNPRFMPLPWEKMHFKIETAKRVGQEKLITYEFVPFLSPNGCYPGSRYTLRRYLEYAGIDNKEI